MIRIIPPAVVYGLFAAAAVVATFPIWRLWLFGFNPTLDDTRFTAVESPESWLQGTPEPSARAMTLRVVRTTLSGGGRLPPGFSALVTQRLAIWLS